MYAQANQPSPTIRPVSMAIAIGINAAVLAALLFAAPAVVRQIPRDAITLIPIKEPPPPPPNPDPPISQARPQPQRPTTPTNPIVETAADPVFTLPPGPTPPIGPATGTGEGTGVAVDPPAPPPPIFVDPSLDQRFAGSFQPDYPPAERRLGREGQVVVRVLIGSDGRVKQVERITATSDDFFNATMRTALARWRFRPATRDGVAIDRWKMMRVTFRLEDA